MSSLAWSLIVALGVAFAADASAQGSPARPQPKNMEKIDDLPPPPKTLIDPKVDPEVTIKAKGEDKIEEYRVRGKLFKMRVIPAKGAPYWLIDNRGDGNFVRIEGGVAPQHAVPQWVLLEW